MMSEPVTSYVPQRADGGVAATDSPRARERAFAVWAALTALAFAVVALMLAAPLASSSGRGKLAHSVYEGFRVVCHQMPERSYYLSGHPLAVCARCAGLYFGFAAGVLAYPLARTLRRTDLPARGWLPLAALPTIIDFPLGVFGLWENTHLSRALTASVLGAAAAFYVVPGVIDAGQLLARRRGRTLRPWPAPEEKRA